MCGDMGGGGFGRGGGVHHFKEEYVHIIHFDTHNYGSMYGDRVEYRFTGLKMVVVTGRGKLF